MPPHPSLSIQVLGTAFVGVGVFFILLVVSILRTFRIFSKSLRKDLPLAKAFHVFMCLFLVCRVAWVIVSVVLEAIGSPLNFEVGFSLNRAAFLFFFTAYTLMVFNWVEIFHRSYQLRTTQALPRLMPLFMLVNILLYAYQIILVVKLYYDGFEDGNPWYDTNILVIVCSFLILSVGFLVYGGAMLWRLEKSRRMVSAGGGSGVAKKVLYAMTIFAGCFLARVVMFSWRLITKEYLPEAIFFIFAYIIPEFLPSVYQVYLMRRVERSAATARAMAHLKEMRSPSHAHSSSRRRGEDEGVGASEESNVDVGDIGIESDGDEERGIDVDIPVVYDEAEDVDVDLLDDGDGDGDGNYNVTVNSTTTPLLAD